MISTVQDYEVEVKEEALPGERTERPLRCSYCRLSHEQVDHLIKSPFNPEVTICGECVMHALFSLGKHKSEGRGNKREMNPELRGLRCSFCNKALEELAWLVTPPATTEVTICDECLAFAESLLDNLRASICMAFAEAFLDNSHVSKEIGRRTHPRWNPHSKVSGEDGNSCARSSRFAPDLR